MISTEIINQSLETLQTTIQDINVYTSYFITTFGCQMNAHDSEKLKGMLEFIGLQESPAEETANIIIYNSCCVRENAENKVYGHLGYLKHIKETTNPNMIICVCGCMMQQAHVLENIKEKYRQVDLIFGTHNLSFFPQLLQTRLETGKMVIDIWDKHEGIDELTESLPTQREFFFKSGVNITYGCDNFCTYCVVPYARGRERSREAADIISEITHLVQDGVVEIMLLGQNVNSYGKGLGEAMNFATLLKAVADIKGLERIRFMTSHPKDLSDEVIEVMRQEDTICKSIHLPVQSGSSRILAKMNRKYDKESYLDLVKKLRKAMPGIPISTDIIVGFPGETEVDFQETLDIVEKVGFSMAYTFYYSPRVGTPAAKMMEQVPREIQQDRFTRLMEAIDAGIRTQNEAKVGHVMKVLIESVNKQLNNHVTGRSDTNDLVHLPGKQNQIGTIVSVKITDCQTYYLLGEQI